MARLTRCCRARERRRGVKLWPGACTLAELMAGPPEAFLAHTPATTGAASPGAWSWQGRRVVELGCGLALCSMVAAHLGAHVLATDGEQGIVGMARRNAAANGCRVVPPAGASAAGPPASRQAGSFRAAQVAWGAGTAAAVECCGLGAPPVDVIVLSDCVYGSDAGAFDALAVALAALAGPHTLVLQAETPRLEGRLYGLYWQAVAAAGFAVADLAAPGGGTAGVDPRPSLRVLWRKA